MTASPPASPSLSPQKASPSGAMPTRASTLTRQPRSRPMSVDLSPTRAPAARPMSMVSIPEKGSPLPSLDSQRFPPSETDRPVLGRTMSSAQSRLDRPNSPTKGMGGFVQSAMLKRTDSANKRWSAHAGPSTLSRQDSTASVLSSRDHQENTESRPSSSHSTISNLNIAPETESKETASKERIGRHSRSRSMASFSGHEPIPEGLMSPPLSPSKRWSRSPAKASWLESALARPESPKPSPQAAQQPSWMAEINKAKQQRNSAENTLPQDTPEPAKAQDSPFGPTLLKRSSLREVGSHTSPARNVTPPTKTKPLSLIGKPTLPEPAKDEAEAPQVESSSSTPDQLLEDLKNEEPVDAKEPEKTEMFKEPEKPKVLQGSALEKEPLKLAHTKSPVLSSAPILPKPKSSDSTMFPTLQSPRSPALKSPELKQDTTPKTDFRSGLKSRSGTIGSASQGEPEFKAIFGKLKKAQTEKYVAPDELKGNILRGKAGLNLSAGPQKSERKDELKESLLKKKDEMTKAAVEKPVEPKISPAPAPVPEALVIKKQLGRPNSLSVPSPEKGRRDITPEALSFHRNLRGKPRAPSPEKRSSISDKPESKRSSIDEKPATPEVEDTPAEEPAAPAEKEEPPKPTEEEQQRLEKQEQPKSQMKEQPKAEIQEQPKPAVLNKFANRFNPAPEQPKAEIKEQPKPAVLNKFANRFNPALEQSKAEIKEQPKPAVLNKFANRFNPAPEQPKAEIKEQPKPAVLNKFADRFNPALEQPKAEVQEQPKPAVLNKFADRFNPALAGLLARGPPQASNPSTPRSGSPSSLGAPSRNVKNSQDEPGDGIQLTHMTKSRAKGPKRRKPQANATVASNVSTIKTTPEKRISSVQSAKVEEVLPSSPAKQTPVQPRPKSAAVRAASINLSRQSSIELDKPKTPTPTKVSLDTPSSTESAKISTPSKASLVTASSTELERPKALNLVKKTLPSLSTTASDISKPSTPVKTPLSTPSSAIPDKSKPPTPAKTSLSTPSSAVSEKSKPPTPAKTSLSTPSTVSDKPKTPSKAFGTPSSNSPLTAQSIPSIVSPLSVTRKTSSSLRPLPAKPLPALNPAAEISEEKPSSVASMRSADSAEADKENNALSVKNAASKWGKQTQQTPPQKRSSPIDLPTRRDEEAAMKSAGLLSSSPLRYQTSPPPRLGLGITEQMKIEPAKRTNSSEYTPPSSAGAPPRPAKSSRVVSGTFKDSLSAKDLPRVPDVLGIQTGRTLAAFFGDVPASSNELQLNTQKVLSSRSGESDKMKTLRKSIQEITVDGKLTSLPIQEEHILYEKSMYICTHVFGTTSGARMTEVYLWCGDSVSEAAIQETQVHAKKIARDAGTGQRSTSLFVVDQAREPAGFFQALGGIVITRRGSRAENVARTYMLCGRPHMGHIAFDEVDLSKSSLCSEYPYIVARPVTLQETKVLLWRGSACTPEAIGSARLIGMDLNPTGDIVEFEEGNEPPEFLRTIGDSQQDICKSPALWSRANASWEHSAVRLFRVEATAPKQSATSLFTSFLSRRPSWSAASDRPGSSSSNKSTNLGGREFEASISEIAPFTQDDLEPEGCYVLDAGSAVLVLPGPLLSKSQLWKHAFTQSLLFAHDYSILSASLEDRPAIPRAAIVFNGLPREAKMKFRRWEEKRGLWGTGGMMAGKKHDDQEQVQLLEVRDALEVCCER